MYLPLSLRESFIYWFHVSYMGLHIGSNRTIRRMSKWLWWPKMNHDVRKYINSCLVCIRKLVPSRLVTISGVLSRPLPLQLVSLDFVGPRSHYSIDFYYLCIVDHASRFMITCPTSKPPTAQWLLSVFRASWVSVFAAPSVVLHDRGTEFRSPIFNDYVLKVLRAHVMNTSAYYPTGNAINESSHRAIDTMLSMCLSQFDINFVDALYHVTLIYNSTPHVSTGHSPFYFLHGFEPTLPGLQFLQSGSNDPTSHLDDLNSLHNNALCRKSLSSAQFNVVQSKSPIKVGDWIVYLLPTAGEKVKQDLVNKFSKLWSLPAKVISIRDRQLTVTTWHSKIKVDVPLAKVRLLQGDVPLSLRELNLQQLQLTSPPEFVQPTFATEHTTTPSTMKQMLDEAQALMPPDDPPSSPRKKRKTRS